MSQRNEIDRSKAAISMFQHLNAARATKKERMEPLHDAHVVLLDELIDDERTFRAWMTGERAMMAAEHRWIDNGCSNTWDDDEFYQQPRF